MKFRVLSLLALLLAAEACADMIGFADDAAQSELETRFDALISAGNQDDWIKRLSQRPHHVGSAAAAENVEFIAALLRDWGFEVELEEYDILFPTPAVRELRLTFPETFVASLEESPLEQDPGTQRTENLLPTYNAFSVGGRVEGELVFVNYGIPEDYELLERHGIDVNGKVVIAKYGRSWRGIKPKLAAEKGAIATIIYSDPADDGFAMGDTYPDGPFKHPTGVQRGSVMDMPLYPGDVLTPGRGATKRAKRLKIEDAETLAKIPVLPISWKDAEPLLRNLGGPVAPQAWRGALPLTYHLGPGPARVLVELKFDWNTVTAKNVIARLAGSESPDQWIIRGNHHDGWNHGAADPLSGLAALLSEAKAVGELAKAGHRPKRTIIYAAWDAEEPGLIGSTEWAEHHADELRRKTVAYINTDGNSRGFLGMGGSHALEPMMNEIAKSVIDPQTGASVHGRASAAILVRGEQKDREDLQSSGRLRLRALGSGSDYTPFLQHLGIASLALGFGGEGEGGSYHTMYDTYEHFTRFRDPGIAYGVALSQVAGRATLRLANADVLPFDFGSLAGTISRYVEELDAMSDKMRRETERRTKLIEDGSYALALDPMESLRPPEAETPVPWFNLAPLKNAAGALQRSAERFDAQTRKMNGKDVARLNAAIVEAEHMLTREEGLPGRPWYRHYIYAPGFYTGYGVKTLPAVREALEERDFDRIDRYIQATAAAIEGLAAHLDNIK